MKIKIVLLNLSCHTTPISDNGWEFVIYLLPCARWWLNFVTTIFYLNSCSGKYLFFQCTSDAYLTFTWQECFIYLLSLLFFSHQPVTIKVDLFGTNIIRNTNLKGGKEMKGIPQLGSDLGDPKYANTDIFRLASKGKHNVFQFIIHSLWFLRGLETLFEKQL